MDTIAAVASPPGPAQRGVIRVSGPAAGALLAATVRPVPPLGARGAFRGRFDDGRGTQPVLVLWMPGPASYTREDVLELHLSGAAPLLEAALARLLELGARLAQPGEFTRRAFEHGRLDLSQAEGVLALVEALNERQARAAAGLLLGGLAERVAGLRDALEEVRALAEASLDFDESDTGHVATEELAALGRAARARLAEALDYEERREPLSGLPRVALVGAPNAGKSSLFNRLTGGAALESDLAGTTRDGVGGLWRLAGVDCALLDTPGLDAGTEHRAGGELDRRAQELALELVEGADLLLWVVDSTSAPANRAAPAALASLLKGAGRRLLVWSKLDLAPGGSAARPVPGGLAVDAVARVSARSGAGLEALERSAAALLGLSERRSPSSPGSSQPGAAGEGPDLGRELSLRHRRALESSARHLDRALEALEGGAPLDQVAQELAQATDALDEVSGRTTPEDLLDRIFARFCLGK